uniref:Uncharacterized protein n=1 Tax=Oryza nivara TaxID=4536 RepID=A0A0E0HQK5_ORYNI
MATPWGGTGGDMSGFRRQQQARAGAILRSSAMMDPVAGTSLMADTTKGTLVTKSCCNRDVPTYENMFLRAVVVPKKILIFTGTLFWVSFMMTDQFVLKL